MKSLSIAMLIALVVGNMVGSGVFLLPASLAQYGSISFFAWIFTSIGAILIAIVFSRLAILSPRCGGPYVYCHEAFGNFTGFLIAYLYWIYSWVGNAAIATSLVSYFCYFLPFIKGDSLTSFFFITGVIWVLTAINILGVQKAGLVQLLTFILKLMPLLLISSIGIFYINKTHFLAFNISHESNFMALAGSASLTMWALTGVESATIPANHVKNPKRNIPLATIIGTTAAIILYIISTTVVMGIIPMNELAASNAPFADAAKKALGPLGGGIVAFAAIISSVGALNGWILLQGQVPYAASNNHAFPRYFGKSSRFGTPINALVTSSILITLLLALNYQKGFVDKFTSIIALATNTILIVYAISMLSEIVILRRRQLYTHFWRKISINMLALAYIVWAMYGSNRDMLLLSLLLLASSLPVYYFCVKRHHMLPGAMPLNSDAL